MKRNRIVILLFITAIMIILVGCKFDVTTTNITNPPNTSTAAQTTAAPSTTAGALTSTLNAGTTTIPVTTVPVTTTTTALITTIPTVATTGVTTTVVATVGEYLGDSFAHSLVLTPGSVKTANIDVGDKYYFCSFVPTVTGNYDIDASGDFDTYLELYDSEQTYYDYDDDSGDGKNFFYSGYFTAGVTYYFVVSMYDAEDVGSFTFVLTDTPVFSFVTNGGTSVEDVSFRFLYEAPITTKTGYYFAGWYDNSGCTGTSISYPYRTNANRTLYALWWNSPVHDGKCFATAYVLNAAQNYTVNISIEGQYAYYVFTPSVSGSYTVQTTGTGDTYGWLLNSSLVTIDQDDEDGVDSNFLITATLEAGSSYYIVASYYYDDEVGSFVINIAPVISN